MHLTGQTLSIHTYYRKDTEENNKRSNIWGNNKAICLIRNFNKYRNLPMSSFHIQVFSLYQPFHNKQHGLLPLIP